MEATVVVVPRLRSRRLVRIARITGKDHLATMVETRHLELLPVVGVILQVVPANQETKVDEHSTAKGVASQVRMVRLLVLVETKQL